MTKIDLNGAEPSLAQLVQALEDSEEMEFVISRDGQLVARLISTGTPTAGQRIGVAKGLFTMPETIDGANEEIARQFGATGTDTRQDAPAVDDNR